MSVRTRIIRLRAIIHLSHSHVTIMISKSTHPSSSSRERFTKNQVTFRMHAIIRVKTTSWGSGQIICQFFGSRKMHRSVITGSFKDENAMLNTLTSHCRGEGRYELNANFKSDQRGEVRENIERIFENVFNGIIERIWLIRHERTWHLQWLFIKAASLNIRFSIKRKLYNLSSS